MRRISTAPVTPVSCVFEPERSATAVRDPLVLTGKPWKRPAARFAAPIPIISWLPRISCPVRAANAVDVEIVSVKDTSAIPRAPANISPRSAKSTWGMVNGGKPCGSSPTSETPLAARSKTAVAAIASDHHDEHRRDLGQPPLQSQYQHNPADADRRRGDHRLAIGHALDESDQVTNEVFAFDLEPEELRELAHQDGDRETVHVADHRRLGDEVGDEAELGHGRQDHDGADHEGKHRRERDRLLRVAVGRDKGQDRRGDHGPERRVRPQDQDAGRAEDRVGEQAEDAGVQPGDRGQSGQLGIGHALRNEQRRQDDPGDDVLAEPVLLVRRDDVEPRHRLAQPALAPLAGLRHICTLPRGAARRIPRQG